MVEFRNEFSWSKSRDEVFQTCPRQYWEKSSSSKAGNWEKNASDGTC